MARFSTDSSLIHYLTTSVLSVTAILLPCIPVPSRISCGVHQGCVLGHLLFTLYILTISILLFPLAHWITTFMQMTPLIHPTSTQGSPTYKPLFNMYSWMIVNLSNLNSFKSEFFLTGLKKQLATTPHSTPLSRDRLWGLNLQLYQCPTTPDMYLMTTIGYRFKPPKMWTRRV